MKDTDALQKSALLLIMICSDNDVVCISMSDVLNISLKSSFLFGVCPLRFRCINVLSGRCKAVINRTQCSGCHAATKIVWIVS